MTHDSKKFLKTIALSLIVGMVLALFAYTCKDVPVFVAVFTLSADLVFISLILALKANYLRFHVPLYLYLLIIVTVFTVVVTGLAVFQMIQIL